MTEWKVGAGQKIEKIYAWVATESDGGEGICTHIDGHNWFPLIGADRARVESLRPAAEAICRALRAPVKLKVFGTGVVIDEIEVPE